MSNGEEPKSIVFIQCVGSRDLSIDRPYCSCICCMQAMKNAMLIKEKHPSIEITLCYMDIRAYGKGYEEYYERAKALGIRFLRGMPAVILADRDGLVLQLENSENSEVHQLHPDLVVLSIGIGPSDNTAGIAATCGIPVEATGFFKSVHDALDTVGTLRPGIYIAGTATAPRDIPDSVASGGSAAMRAYIDAMRTRST
jgi:heterodisulfide reductase subunit A